MVFVVDRWESEERSKVDLIDVDVPHFLEPRLIGCRASVSCSSYIDCDFLGLW